MNPETFAAEVGVIYEESFVQLDAIIGTKPAFNNTLFAAVEKLKEDVIQKMIVYGRARAEMSEADQKMCSTRLGMKMERAYYNPLWSKTMQECYQHYVVESVDFGTLIAAFNIITQYAQFELLRQQAPTESDRLGV